MKVTRVNVFNRSMYLDSPYSYNRLIMELDYIRNHIHEELLYHTSGNPELSFYSNDDYFHFDMIYKSDLFYWICETKKINCSHLDFILANSTLNEAEMKRLNAHYKWICSYVFTFNPDIIQIFVDETVRLIDMVSSLLKSATEEEEQKKAFEKEKKEALLSKISSWDTRENTIRDEGGITKYYIHTFVINRHKIVLKEYNVFDFGRVISIHGGSIRLTPDKTPAYLDKDDNLIPLTEEEALANQIVTLYGSTAKQNIRM